MAGWGQLGVGGGAIGYLGAGRGLLGMSKGLTTGGAVRCWLGVAIFIFLRVDALEANQVLNISYYKQHSQSFTH